MSHTSVQEWDVVLKLLEQPELIAEEVAKQEVTTDDQRAEIRRQMALIKAALAKCERDEQLRRWIFASPGPRAAPEHSGRNPHGCYCTNSTSTA
jgi:hypothetical protein